MHTDIYIKISTTMHLIKNNLTINVSFDLYGMFVYISAFINYSYYQTDQIIFLFSNVLDNKNTLP